MKFQRDDNPRWLETTCVIEPGDLLWMNGFEDENGNLDYVSLSFMPERGRECGTNCLKLVIRCAQWQAFIAHFAQQGAKEYKWSMEMDADMKARRAGIGGPTECA